MLAESWARGPHRTRSRTDSFAALNEAADNEPDEARKGKLRRAAEAAAGVGREILTDVTAQVITKGMYGG